MWFFKILLSIFCDTKTKSVDFFMSYTIMKLRAEAARFDICEKEKLYEIDRITDSVGSVA